MPTGRNFFLSVHRQEKKVNPHIFERFVIMEIIRYLGMKHHVVWYGNTKHFIKYAAAIFKAE